MAEEPTILSPDEVVEELLRVLRAKAMWLDGFAQAAGSKPLQAFVEDWRKTMNRAQGDFDSAYDATGREDD